MLSLHQGHLKVSLILYVLMIIWKLFFCLETVSTPVKTPDKKLNLMLYIEEPDIILIESLEDVNTNAIIFNVILYSLVDRLVNVFIFLFYKFRLKYVWITEQSAPKK